MLLDRFRKKNKRQPGKNDASLEVVDISDQVPQIDDTLAEVEKALKTAQELQNQLLPPNQCTC